MFHIVLMGVHGTRQVKNRWLRHCSDSPPFAEPKGSLRRSQEKADFTPTIILCNIIFPYNKTHKISIIDRRLINF
jgi:hypothetical protein